MTQNGSRVQILGTQSGESFSSSPKVFPTAKQKWPSNVVNGKDISPQYKRFPVTGAVLGICKCTPRCFVAVEKTLKLKTVSSSTKYLTVKKGTLGTNTHKYLD